MVFVYIVLSFVAIFSSFTETLGSEETKILVDILSEISLMRTEMNQMYSMKRETDEMMDNRMEKLIRQVEDLRDSHFPTNTSNPTLPLRTTAATPSSPRPPTPSPTPPTLPPQPSVCTSYIPITDSWRHIDYVNRGKFPGHCDKTGSHSHHTNLGWGSWFRFNGAAGTKLPTALAPGGRPQLGYQMSGGNQICGTFGVAWLTIPYHPTIKDGIVTRDVCFEGSPEMSAHGSKCWGGKTTVGVAACRDIHGDDFVYQLQQAPDCDFAYCAID